jgi:hypothetical protein
MGGPWVVLALGLLEWSDVGAAVVLAFLQARHAVFWEGYLFKKVIFVRFSRTFRGILTLIPKRVGLME